MRRAAIYPESLKNIEHIKDKIELVFGDLSTDGHLCSIIHNIKPDEIYNLAAQSDVRISFDIPEYTCDVTGLGVLRLLEAIKNFSPNSKLYQASSCFPANTKIICLKKIYRNRYGKDEVFNSLGTKNIEDLEIGDKVLSYNEKTSAKEYKEIEAVSNRIASDMYIVKFSNNNELTLSGNHPVYVINKGWMRADLLEIGDEVIQKRYNGLFGGIIRKGKNNSEIYGLEKASYIKNKSSLAHKGNANHMKGRKSPEGHPIRAKNPRKAHKSWNEGLTIETSDKLKNIGNKISDSQLKVWQREGYKDKKIKQTLLANQKSFNTLEKKVSYILRNVCPHEFKYNGDGRLMVLGGKVPDFINVNGKKKVIEVFAPIWKELNYGSTEKYLQQRTKTLKKLGYETLFIESKELKNTEVLKNKIKTFVHNPAVDIVKIVSIQYKEIPTKVYNVEVKDNHNFFAKGILVHNSEMYGTVAPPQNENGPFNPQNPYAVAKLFAFHQCRIYRKAYKMFIANGILFNHESERRGLNFVTRKITHAVAEIAKGKKEFITLGNLDAKRDWGYAPEYCEAMWMMLQHDKPEDFVVGTGEVHTVREFVDETFAVAGIRDPQKHIIVDSMLLRPSETHYLQADIRKTVTELGWKPKVHFKDLVKIMYELDFKSV